MEVKVIGLAKRTRTASVAEQEAVTRGVLAANLRDAGWRVEAQPVLGSTKPDLLVSDDSGRTYLVELKRAPRGVHFGSVAQTAAFRDVAGSTLGHDVQAMLVIVGADAQELDAAGRDYGVEVLGTVSSDPSDIAVAVHNRLAKLSTDAGAERHEQSDR